MRKKSIIAICSLVFILILAVISFYFYNKTLAKASGEFFGEPFWVFTPQRRIVASLLDDNSRLFIQTLDSIYSLDIHTGNILWQTNLPADPVYGTPMMASGDILLAQGQRAEVAAYSADSGKLLWNHVTDNYWIENMAIYENNLYIARYNAYLTAYNLSDGEILWSKDVPSRNSLFVFADKDIVYLGTNHLMRIYDEQYSIPVNLFQEHNFKDAVNFMKKAGNTLYVAYYKNEGISILALDVSTFEDKWNIPYSQLPHISSINSMAIENDVLYAIGNRVAAISLQDGKVLWITNEEISYEKSVIFRDVIYAMDETYLHIFNKNTGVETKRVPLPGLPSLVSLIQGKHANLMISDGFIILVSNGQVYCYPRSVLTTAK
jgi:outer membrane protein assembly factor BamB